MRKSIFSALAVGLMLGAVALASGVRYVSVDQTPLYGSEEADTELTALRVTSEVEVLEEGDAHSLVKITGFIRAEAESDVVFTNTVDEIEITTAVDASLLTQLAAAEGFAEVELTGYVANEALVEDREEMFTTAAGVYQRYCSRCHVGYAGPVEQLIERLRPREWPSFARRMAVGTGISDSDLNLIIHWLQTESQAARAE